MTDRQGWAAERLKYRFTDPQLLDLALTHRSRSGRNNERLEFLGDSILNFLIAEELYGRFPQAKEGVLSRMRANLVRKETLATLARGLELGEQLLLGGGELKSGGHRRDSILGDALEAVIGAVYLDGGLGAAKSLVQRLFTEALDAAHPERVLKDPKTRLQEVLQKQSLNIPTYNLLEVRGEPHNQLFVVECVVNGLAAPVRGEGRSRRSAEQQAAAKAYGLLTGADE